MTKTCPSCGSNSPNARNRICVDPNRPYHGIWCNDPWHDAKEEKMEYYGHCPKCGELLGFGHLPEKCDKAPAQATREQLEAALRTSIHALKETYRILSYFVSHSDDCNFGANNPEGDYCTCRVQRHTRNMKALVDSVTAEAERLLGGK